MRNVHKDYKNWLSPLLKRKQKKKKSKEEKNRPSSPTNNNVRIFKDNIK